MIITGNIESIIYRNEDNGYSVLTVEGDRETITCVGVFPPIQEGEGVRLTGEVVDNPKYGRQLKVAKFESCGFEDSVAIERYLASGVIKGVGPVTAAAMVAMYGDKTLEVMEHAPYRLAKVRGVSVKKAQEIGEQYKEIKTTQEAVMYLQQSGMTLPMALKIIKVYGESTIAVVKTNPYRLIEDVSGVGFATADKIACRLGISKDSAFRLRAGIVYVLGQSAERAGNTYLPYDGLRAAVEELLEIDIGGGSEDGTSFDGIVDLLTIEQKIKILKVDDYAAISPMWLYKSERAIATKLMSKARLVEQEDVRGEIEIFERTNKVEFHTQQKKAIELATSGKVVVITGGPGTGKTTIVRAILEINSGRGRKVALMAPTGRAAKRLSESTGSTAYTIHRLLIQSMGTIDADVVIVDEVSMVDVQLMHMLLNSLAPDASIVMVGDKDQLPSVGAGNVLGDILASGLIPSVALTHIYRQGGDSLIISNAHAINNGKNPILTQTGGDFFFKSVESADIMAAECVSMAAKRLPKYLGVDPHRIQVLAAMKNGPSGTNNLNRLLQGALNPKSEDKTEYALGDLVFREGDKVMHITNNYELVWHRDGGAGEEGTGVFNGDLGCITEIVKGGGHITVEFEDGRVSKYTPDLYSQLMLAYAVTVHKSQGSEFDAVVMPVTSGSYVINTRNLLYTAITRAKKLVVLIGEEENIAKMVRNNYIAKRHTGLKQYLADASQEVIKLYGNG